MKWAPEIFEEPTFIVLVESLSKYKATLYLRRKELE